MQVERRRRERIEVDLPVELESNKRKLSVKSFNISLKGVLCVGNQTPLDKGTDFEVGNRCKVHIVLGPYVTLMIHGRVVRTLENEVAIDFEYMDRDSFRHLRKIVEWNSGNADPIEEEMSTSAY